MRVWHVLNARGEVCCSYHTVANKGFAIASKRNSLKIDYECASVSQKMTDDPLTFEDVPLVDGRLGDAVLILAILAILAVLSILVVLVAFAILVVATKTSRKRGKTVGVWECAGSSFSNFVL